MAHYIFQRNNGFGDYDFIVNLETMELTDYPEYAAQIDDYYLPYIDLPYLNSLGFYPVGITAYNLRINPIQQFMPGMRGYRPTRMPAAARPRGAAPRPMPGRPIPPNRMERPIAPRPAAPRPAAPRGPQPAPRGPVAPQVVRPAPAQAPQPKPQAGPQAGPRGDKGPQGGRGPGGMGPGGRR